MFIEPSTNALIKRINHKLAYQGEKLHVTRGKRARPDLGDLLDQQWPESPGHDPRDRGG